MARTRAQVVLQVSSCVNRVCVCVRRRFRILTAMPSAEKGHGQGSVVMGVGPT